MFQLLCQFVFCVGVVCCFHWGKTNFHKNKVEKVRRLKFLFSGLDLPTAKYLQTFLCSRFYRSFPVGERNLSRFLIKINFRRLKVLYNYPLKILTYEELVFDLLFNPIMPNESKSNSSFFGECSKCPTNECLADLICQYLKL